MKTIYDILAKLNISYEKHDHPAVFTVEESSQYDMGMKDAGKSKNLFLRNKKETQYYLVVVESTKRLDLKSLASSLNEQKLSFASPEKLKEFLDLTPGSVSPFGLMNDSSKSVKVVVDNDLINYEKVGFHPNINTATLVITTEDFKKFLEWTENEILYFKISFGTSI